MPPPIAVIDFETTGSSPATGARATEIAAVLVQDGRIVGQYQSLMNSGAWVPPFIEQLTGISNAMLADAPPAAQVMGEVMRFTQGCPLVAHNAGFDRGFWRAEAALAGQAPDPAHEFACTVRLAREGSIRRRRTTAWARWPRGTGCRTTAVRTARWPTPPPPHTCCCASCRTWLPQWRRRR